MHGVEDRYGHEEYGYHGAHYVHRVPGPYERAHGPYDGDHGYGHGRGYEGEAPEKDHHEYEYQEPCHGRRDPHLPEHLHPEGVLCHGEPRYVVGLLSAVLFDYGLYLLRDPVAHALLFYGYVEGERPPVPGDEEGLKHRGRKRRIPYRKSGLLVGNLASHEGSNR